MSDLSEEVEALLLNEENYEAVGVALKRWGMVAIPEGELTVLRLRAERSVPQESERESEVMRALHDFRDAGGSAERVVAAIRGLMAPRSEGIEKDADEVERIVSLVLNRVAGNGEWDYRDFGEIVALTSSRETGGTNG